MTEDLKATPPESDAGAPFSELIRDWLDEGDQLDATAAKAAPAVPPSSAGPLRRIARGLGPAFDRHRLFVLAAIGLLPFALFLLTNHHPPSAPVAVAAAVETPVTAPPASVAAAATRPPVVATVVRAPSAAVPAGAPPTPRPDPGASPRRRSSHHHRRRPGLAHGR